MMCLRLHPHHLASSSSPLSLSLSLTKSKSLRHHLKPFSSSTVKMSQTIEHIVLFKVKPATDPTKLASMVNGLHSLASLDQVLHLSAGPIHRNRSVSSPLAFTHMLHSRYTTKDDLASYSAHPAHMGVVKESVLPICDDIMAVDWVADLDDPVVVEPGKAMRVSFLKLKEGEKGEEVLSVIGGIKGLFGSIEQISFGENFSPARAKGYSIASIAVLPGLKELDELDGNEEVVKAHKEKVRDLLESVLVFDYVVQPAASL